MPVCRIIRVPAACHLCPRLKKARSVAAGANSQEASRATGTRIYMAVATTASVSRGMRALAVLGRCVRAPFRVLVRARDLYVSRMAACAGAGGGMGPVGMVAVPRCQSHGFYRSAAGGGTDDDVRELIRAASRAAAGPPRPPGVGPRSRTVAIGRIDEDRPCEFGLEDGERAQALGPRSKSCAVVPSSARTRTAVVAPRAGAGIAAA
ncbi:hypothetical protein BS78_01G093900 [Paspalum vaginatum]|nr:hypothetical protein BS78_01G093900 [Paspalum vaginatum]